MPVTPTAPASTGRRAAAAALVTAALLAGCSGGSGTAAPATSTSSAAPSSATSPAAPSATTAAPSPSVTVPACATRVADAAGGYRVALPCGYTRITDKAQLKANLTQGYSVVKGDLKAAAEQVDQAKLFAVNARTGSRIVLFVTPAQGLRPEALPSQRPAITRQLQSVGATGLTFSDVTVAGGQALRARTSMVTKTATLQLVQVYAVHSDQIYVWTLTGTKALPAEEALVLGTFTYA